MSGGEGGGAWEVANVPCPGERGEGAGKWLMYHVWGRGGGAWKVVNIVQY